MVRRGFAKTIAVVAVAGVVFGVIGYAVMQPTTGWPTEDRRVVHPAGFSAVQPLGWERHVINAGPQTGAVLRFLPIKSIGAPGVYAVSKLSTPPVHEELTRRGYTPTTFQGQPAYEKWLTGALTREHAHTIVFQRGDAWYDVTLRRPDTEVLDRGVWQKYAESFRIEAPQTPPAPPTVDLIDAATGPSAPASMPAFTPAAAP